MKQLNNQSKKIFSLIMKKMEKRPYIRLESAEFMPITVEIVNRFITTEAGEAALYSITHYHEQNGVSLRDPQMCFLVIDCRIEPQEFNKLIVIPQMFRQDSRGIHDESINIENNIIVSYQPSIQHDQCLFANQWLQNIQQQGFLK